jgi:hypothetical protein
LALAGNAAFELSFHFLGAPLLQRIGATAHDQRACSDEQAALHLLILESEPCNASVVAVFASTTSASCRFLEKRRRI